MRKNKFYLFFLTLFLATISVTSNAQNTSLGETVEGIPEDWQNDLWLNTHFQRLEIAQTYQIIARRVPEIIDNSISNQVTLPPFHYEIIDGTSISVDENGLITANELGTSTIKVTYDEVVANGTTYGAVSPVNITYLIVDVIDPLSKPGLNLSTDINFRSYDTYYFTGNFAEYTFRATAENADNITVKCNNKTVEKNGNSYTVKLENRANIVEVVATKDGKKEKLYYVLDGRKIEINIANVTNPDKHFEAGDKARVSFKGITLPVYKLATIYNPQMEMPAWDATATRVHYTNNAIGNVKTNVDITQYDLATNNTIEMTLPNEANYRFGDGHIYEYWWGSALGTEKDMSGPGEPNLNAGVLEDRFSFLPDFNIGVGYLSANFEDIDLQGKQYIYADATDAAIYSTVTMNLKSGSFAFKNSATNWGSMTSWIGIAVSQQTDAETPGGLNNQFNSAAGGDVSGSGKYGVVYDANSGGMGMGPDYAITFTNKDYPQGRVVEGCYITNSTWATNSMKNGDSYAKKFGGETGNDKDYFILKATGYDAEGNETGNVDFFLADFRDENNTKDYIVEDWRWMDLTSLGQVSSVKFSMSSSNVGTYGMNTPAYFAIDNMNEKRLFLSNPIQSITVAENSEPTEIDLSQVFADTENLEITKSIAYNTNPELVTVNVIGDKMTLSYAENKTGTAEISIRGGVQKMGAYSDFLVMVDSETGLSGNSSNTINIFPNPATNYITLSSDGVVTIYLLNGGKVYQNNNYKANEKIELSHLAEGIYFVTQNGATAKLIKK